jgi:hypothetical protein
MTTGSVCPRRTWARRLLVAGVLMAAVGLTNAAVAQLAEPFRTRNLNPFVSLSIWPTWQLANPRARHEFIAVAEAANHYRLSLVDGERLVLDGETWRGSLFWQRQFQDQWSVAVDVPWLRQSGGVLDNVVDAFHSAFDLPDGGRNFRPEDRLEVYLGGAAGTAFELTDTHSALGDVQVSVSRRFGSADRRWLAQASLSLPTGDRESLTGSGESGAALGLLRSRTLEWLARPAGIYWGATAMLTSDPALPGFEMRSTAYLGTLGGAWQPWARVGFKLQLDAHSALYTARLTELGSAGVQATLGGWWQGRGSRRFEIAVNEDLRVSTSPDVVLHVAVHWDWQ